MKKLALAVAVMTSAASVTAYASDARTMAMGGASIASSDFRSSASNPALSSIYGMTDDFSIQLSGGLEASDRDQMLDAIDDLQDAIDTLDQRINDGSAVPGDEQDVLDRLAALDGRTVDIGAGAGVTVALPSSAFGASLFVRSDARFGVDFDYDSNDSTQIQTNLIAGDPVDTNLNSRVRGSGYGMTEAGIAISHTFTNVGPGDLSVGVSPKYLRIDLFNKDQRISDFETSEVNDSLVEDSGFNADLGALYAFGENRQYSVAARVKNVVPVEVTGTTGDVFEVDPLATVGFSYNSSWFTSTVEADVTEMNGYGNVAPSQYARAGIELNAANWAQVRVGYRHDISDGREDVITAGLGISPFDVLNVDVTGIYGENDTYGAVVQVGLSF